MDGGRRQQTSQRRNCQGESAFRSSMLLASEAIVRRNVAAIEPDRIQTRCRGGGARARLRDKQTGLDCGTGRSRRAILSALQDGRITLCYSVIRVSRTSTGNPPYSMRSYSPGEAGISTTVYPTHAACGPRAGVGYGTRDRSLGWPQVTRDGQRGLEAHPRSRGPVGAAEILGHIGAGGLDSGHRARSAHARSGRLPYLREVTGTAEADSGPRTTVP